MNIDHAAKRSSARTVGQSSKRQWMTLCLRFGARIYGFMLCANTNAVNILVYIWVCVFVESEMCDVMRWALVAGH